MSIGRRWIFTRSKILVLTHFWQYMFEFLHSPMIHKNEQLSFFDQMDLRPIVEGFPDPGREAKSTLAFDFKCKPIILEVVLWNFENNAVEKWLGTNSLPPLPNAAMVMETYFCFWSHAKGGAKIKFRKLVSYLQFEEAIHSISSFWVIYF